MTDALPDKVDLTNCDREPIHQLGNIQPFAWLLGFTSDWTTCRVSENIASLLGIEPAETLGMHINEIFAEEAIHSIRTRCTLLGNNDVVERMFGLHLLPDNEDRFDVAIHRSDRSIIIEIERHMQDRIGEASSLVRSMMVRLDGATDTAEFMQIGARMVRAMIDFDRVMVYRFDRDGHGTVVAESLSAGTDSFLGLHYPASDIPKQARKLYLRSPFRIIADVHAQPVGILPERNEFGEPLDLSLSIARAVSPIHIEYLTNMGVDASLSISIIIDGKLWGLFACHHYSPLLPSFNARSLAELFGQMFSLRLEGRLRNEIMAHERKARSVGERLLSGIADDADLLSNPELISRSLRDIIANDGVGTLTDGTYGFVGSALPQDVVEALAKRLNAMEPGRIIVQEDASKLAPLAAEHTDIAAGFMAIPISRKPRDYVFLFRREQTRTVSWAGNPEKPVTVGANGIRLTPRGSFEQWREEVRGSCEPFSESEIYIGEALRSVMAEVVLRITESAQAESRKLAERQDLLIAELNHRVRNILALVRGIVRQSDSGGHDTREYITMLDGRIEALARAHDQITRERWAASPLRPLFEVEAKVYLEARSERLITNGPDVDLMPEAYSTMALVVHELVTNSAKYGALSDSGIINVDWHIGEEGNLEILWKESGGPPVKPPMRRGFGSTIIERTIPHDLGGEVGISYHITGLVAKFIIPARCVKLHRKANGASTENGQRITPNLERAPMLQGMPQHMLVVEDSMIIALDVEQHLLDIGIKKVSVASNVTQALDILAAAQIDAALLDVNLGIQVSTPVAEELLKRQIPFAFASGYGEALDLGGQFSHIERIQKPFNNSRLNDLIKTFSSAG